MIDWKPLMILVVGTATGLGIVYMAKAIAIKIIEKNEAKEEINK